MTKRAKDDKQSILDYATLILSVNVPCDTSPIALM